MPGHDEETIRKNREKQLDEVPGDGGMEIGGTGRVGDIGAGGAATDPEAFGRMAGGQPAPDDPVTGVGGIGDTGITDAEPGATRDRTTPGIGTSSDRTDEDLLENR